MIEAIKKRRAVREYLNESIGEQKIKEVINSAMYAPSANDIHPWEIIVVKDSLLKEKLSKTTPWSAHAKEADVVVVVIGHEAESANWVEDCSIVAEHIWLEATQQDLGSCWIQIRGNVNAEKAIKEIFGIPAEHRILCLMPIGVPAKELPEHSEEEFDKSKIKYEKY
ncbi:MAG: nitroreductase family protein [Candidatus Buchananbacteria bacterium]